MPGVDESCSADNPCISYQLQHCLGNNFGLMHTSMDCLQVLLVLSAVLAIPWMLIPKPYFLKKRHEARQAQLASYGRVSPHDEDEESGEVRMVAAHHDEEEFEYSEILVHQVTNNLAFCPEKISGVVPESRKL